MRATLAGLLALSAPLIFGCGDQAQLPEPQAQGPNPQIPAPRTSWIPTVNIADATGWPENERPMPAQGLAVKAFASGLDHPRWLAVLPNGDVLVAETNAPERPEDAKGIKGWFFGLFQKWAGAGTPSANRITLLRDPDKDGVAEERHVLLQNLNSPFGMALIGNALYVANTDAILRFPYSDGDTEITAPGEKIADLPAGEINHHWTKNIIASPDGAALYATVGSNSNAAENGLDVEVQRAAILKIDLATRQSRIFASGLRNPNGLGWEPKTGKLWTVVNERDELGSDLVPDYLTSVQDGHFYGWPFSYWGQHVDTRVEPQNPELVKRATVPDYALGNHVAPLGLAFARGDAMPEHLRHGVFIGEHGSWNREPLSGYKVVFVSFADGKPQGPPIDVLTGFVNKGEEAPGRPVGVAIDRGGALLVADDVGNTIWRVSAISRAAASN
ncbi:PQQ-dependent sugar dehydrogenase [Dongia sp.]|uniref:PQQ-dependent sugar dehydrogenase n=1 Tax=Dongia sp. TaxID=1977262 RepID=UPI003751DA20